MEAPTVQAPQGDALTADEEFDPVISDLEQGVPDHRQKKGPLPEAGLAPHDLYAERVIELIDC